MNPLEQVSQLGQLWATGQTPDAGDELDRAAVGPVLEMARSTVSQSADVTHSAHVASNGQGFLQTRSQLQQCVAADLPVHSLHAGEPYPSSHRGHLIKSIPVRGGHSLHLHWVVPPLDDLWAENPAGFLGHMIGHEGKGSLFSLLKESGWVTSLGAGGFPLLRGSSIFSVTIRLTDAGALSCQSWGSGATSLGSERSLLFR
jgi:secreted Zn-dependent insulinase-like peptidase